MQNSAKKCMKIEQNRENVLTFVTWQVSFRSPFWLRYLGVMGAIPEVRISFNLSQAARWNFYLLRVAGGVVWHSKIVRFFRMLRGNDETRTYINFDNLCRP
jgi:hypothetical protein